MRRLTSPIAILLVSSCCFSGGCAVTRKSASIDSTSRLPWLGFELAPRQREPAPETHRIRLEGSEQPAKLVMPALNRKEASRRSLKKSSPEKPAAIAIPRTDGSEPPPSDELALDELHRVEF